MSAAGLSSRAIIGRFYHELEQRDPASWIEPIARLFISDQESEDYVFTDQAPSLREWICGRAAKSLYTSSITIRNRHWESTLEIPVDWIRRDKTDQIQVRIRELARRAESHFGSLLSELILSGETALCFDQKPYYATDHPLSFSNGYVSGSQSNKKDFDVLTPTTPDADDFGDAVMHGISTLLNMKDETDDSEPYQPEAKKFLVMVPPSFLKTSSTALGADLIDGSSSGVRSCANQLGFDIALAINPRLRSWTTKFIVCRADSGAMTSFIRQQETGIKVDALADGSEHEFRDDTHLYGVSCHHAVGFGDYRQSCLITFV
jgi:hypothetical protein